MMKQQKPKQKPVIDFYKVLNDRKREITNLQDKTMQLFFEKLNSFTLKINTQIYKWKHTVENNVSAVCNYLSQTVEQL
jgi:hypothetical protein